MVLRTLGGAGNLIGHAAVQTTLSGPVNAGDTALAVASVAGLADGDRLLIDLPGAAGSEPVRIRAAQPDDQSDPGDGPAE